MSKHYYERSKFSEFQSNTTYHRLLEMTDDEFAQYQADQATEVARKAEAEAKATAKAALLTQLGITAEQAKLLLS